MPETPPPEVSAPLPMARPGVSAKRLSPLTALLWLWDPKRRTLVMASGALVLFTAGIWAGSAMERRSSRASDPASQGIFLERPAATTARPGTGASGLPTQSSAGGNLVRFSGRWVVPEGGAPAAAGPPMAADRRRPEGFAEPAPQPPRNQNLAPQDLNGPWQPARKAFTPSGFSPEGGASGGSSAGLPAPAQRAGTRVGRVTPLAAVPSAGTAREVRDPLPAAAGAAGPERPGQFAGREAPPQTLTSEGAVNPITTDASKSFAVFEGQGPHVPQETGAAANSGERTRVNLGGATGAAGANNGGANR